jgi:hypothetical protein
LNLVAVQLAVLRASFVFAGGTAAESVWRVDAGSTRYCVESACPAAGVQHSSHCSLPELLLLLVLLNPTRVAVDDDVPKALFDELALTELQQSTLCPLGRLPLAVQPLHWAHEQMRNCCS